MKLKGKTAIITGATQGIGRSIAMKLASEGADVVVNSRHINGATEVAEDIEATTGRRVLAFEADVSQSRQVDDMVKATLRKLGRIDILVNNAGIALTSPTEELTEAQWDLIMNVNLKGVFICSQSVGRQLIRQKQGKIINIASLGGHRGVPKMVAYSASKGGVILFTRALAVEWAKYNINVNAVSPGFTETPMVEKLKKDSPGFYEERLKAVPLKRATRPEDIASAVLFLASSESDAITGQVIIVDGGTAALHPGFPDTA
jgi:NAD(P)-dependent dehydrogenase (short-subunit alcohol dehydrogenase family)